MPGSSFDNSFFDWTSDAGARAVLTNLIAQITAVSAAGFIQQAPDTGQVNTATYTRPTTGFPNYNAYIILKCTDSLSGTAPVYCRVDIGGSSTTLMTIRTSYGPSTDGAGNLTGAWASSLMTCTRNSSIVSTTTNYQSWMSSKDIGFGIGFKLGSCVLGGYGFFGFARPCNADGTLRSDAIITVGQVGAGVGVQAECINFASANKYGAINVSNAFCLIPQNLLSSVTGGSFQYFEHRYATPAVVSTNMFCSLLGTEVGLGVQNSATPNGVAPTYTGNYVSLGGGTAATGLTQAAVSNGGTGSAAYVATATLGMLY